MFGNLQHRRHRVRDRERSGLSFPPFAVRL
jgi:hypothetical protein